MLSIMLCDKRGYINPMLSETNVSGVSFYTKIQKVLYKAECLV